MINVRGSPIYPTQHPPIFTSILIIQIKNVLIFGESYETKLWPLCFGSTMWYFSSIYIWVIGPFCFQWNANSFTNKSIKLELAITEWDFSQHTQRFNGEKWGEINSFIVLQTSRVKHWVKEFFCRNLFIVGLCIWYVLISIALCSLIISFILPFAENNRWCKQTFPPPPDFYFTYNIWQFWQSIYMTK